jgi:hypothetical protein
MNWKKLWNTTRIILFGRRNILFKKVIFYHHWHFGDCLVGKAYVRLLINYFKQFGDVKFYYTHPCGPKVLSDLPTEYIPWEVGVETVPIMYDKITVREDTLFINTWIGAYTCYFDNDQLHGNFQTFNQSWKCTLYIIENLLNLRIISANQGIRMPTVNMLPTTDWSFYEISPAQNFVKDKKDIVLFCNSVTASCQTRNSGIELMVDTINSIANKNPSTTFVCTQKIPVDNRNGNIFFTDDIFENVEGGDINEIAYLSTFCKMIIGKSSGPYTFCHVKDNILREDCIFYCITDRQSDCLLYDFFDSKSRNYQFVGKYEQMVEHTIHGILNNTIENLSQFAVFLDTKFINLRKNIDHKNH